MGQERSAQSVEVPGQVQNDHLLVQSWPQTQQNAVPQMHHTAIRTDAIDAQIAAAAAYAQSSRNVLNGSISLERHSSGGGRNERPSDRGGCAVSSRDDFP